MPDEVASSDLSLPIAWAPLENRPWVMPCQDAPIANPFQLSLVSPESSF
jgi:hypothetical protein